MSTAARITKQLFQVDRIRYGIVFVNVRESQKVDLNCNTMIIINQGETTASLNQALVLPPNKFLSIPGELFEEMEQTFQVSFTGAGENNLVFVLKVYL